MESDEEAERALLTPRILGQVGDVIFVYKPPFWHCTNTAASKVRQTLWKNEKDMSLFLTRERIVGMDLQLHWWLQTKLGDDIFFSLEAGLGLCNRLDKETSGVVLAARAPNAWTAVRALFRTKRVLKLYVTLLHGRVLAQSGEGIRVRVCGDTTRGHFTGLVSSHFHVLSFLGAAKKETSSFGSAYFDRLSLCAVEIREGLTHQIRKHAQYLATSVVADKIYRDPCERDESTLLGRQFLHAYATAIPLPDELEGGRVKWICCVCSLPGDLRKLLGGMHAEKVGWFDETFTEGARSVRAASLPGLPTTAFFGGNDAETLRLMTESGHLPNVLSGSDCSDFIFEEADPDLLTKLFPWRSEIACHSSRSVTNPIFRDHDFRGAVGGMSYSVREKLCPLEAFAGERLSASKASSADEGWIPPRTPFSNAESKRPSSWREVAEDSGDAKQELPKKRRVY
jgi:23S rRNA-/tRNA-specific pseudouridylate synthase